MNLWTYILAYGLTISKYRTRRRNLKNYNGFGFDILIAVICARGE